MLSSSALSYLFGVSVPQLVNTSSAWWCPWWSWSWWSWSCPQQWSWSCSSSSWWWWCSCSSSSWSWSCPQQHSPSWWWWCSCSCSSWVFSACCASISSSRFVTFSIAPRIWVPSISSHAVVIICASGLTSLISSIAFFNLSSLTFCVLLRIIVPACSIWLLKNSPKFFI